MRALILVLTFITFPWTLLGSEKEIEFPSSHPFYVQLEKTLPRFAQGKTTILIQGESGTGKEVMAQKIHALSPRKDKPLLAVNVAAIGTSLLDSELFGHEKGAFTGASGKRDGLFAQANGGTLFLDELGEMPLEMQSKLLRVLENGEYYRVGSSQVAKTDVRIIAATNANLAKKVMEGTFREDLFYRLTVVVLELPPLRERKQDIAPLAQHFLQLENLRLEASKQFHPETMEWILHHPWPGNIRQLKNSIQRAALLSEANEITIEDFGNVIEGFGPAVAPLLKPVEEGEWSFPQNREDFISIEKLTENYCAHVLEALGNNQSEAARVLGIGRAKMRAIIQNRKP